LSCRVCYTRCVFFFFFSSRRRHTRSDRDWSSDVCSSDLFAGTLCETVRYPSVGQLHILNGGKLTLLQSGQRDLQIDEPTLLFFRSEERRVGKECIFCCVGAHVK